MFTLTMVTPEKKLLVGQEIEEVFVPAHRGELNVLPGHAPLMSTLRAGVLKYRLKGDSTVHHVAISWGYCQVNPFGVSVLAETVETPEEIDVARAEVSFKEAEQRSLSETMDETAFEANRAQMARAMARKQAAALARNRV
jgi:F-type H+-transporting ATPase subunit epsilon